MMTNRYRPNTVLRLGREVGRELGRRAQIASRFRLRRVAYEHIPHRTVDVQCHACRG